MGEGVRRFALVSASIVALGLSGCGGGGPERAEVQGTVTFQNAPLPEGSIAFLPDEGVEGPAVGGSIRDGKYHLTGNDSPATGLHRVRVVASRSTGRKVPAGEGADDPAAMVDEIEMFIPAKYNTRTILTADVQPGSNEFDFALTD